MTPIDGNELYIIDRVKNYINKSIDGPSPAQLDHHFGRQLLKGKKWLFPSSTLCPRPQEMHKHTRTQFLLLLLLQLCIAAFFFVFCRYAKPAVVTTPKPALRTDTETANNIAVSGFMDVHVMIFIGFGFLMTFLKKYSHSALGFNLMLAALSVQLALIGTNVYKMESNIIHITKKSLLEADIMAATVLITFGAVLGVASGTQLLVITVFETAFACANFWLLDDYLKAADIGGSMAIHAFGSCFGIGVSWALGVKTAKLQADAAHENLEKPSYVSDVTAMIGSLFLWVYWPSFNAGLTKSEIEYERAITNTYLSLAACTVTTFAMSAIMNKEKGKFDMVHVQNSTLAGGVAVGSICNMFIGPGGAIIVGFGAGIISVVGYRQITPQLNKIGILDTCGVNNLHGMPGIYSGILSIVFAALAKSDYSESDIKDVFPGRGTDRNETQQALFQCLGLVATIVISLVSGLFIGFILRLPVFKQLKDFEHYNDDLYWQTDHSA